MAWICGTPAPVTIRVVQIDPGPMPTLMPSTPRAISARAPRRWSHRPDALSPLEASDRWPWPPWPWTCARTAGSRPGYELKLNSYDLGVDIELYDAVQRLRFEHPEVGAVILTSAKERVFCAGANIRMLGQSSHGWKVNFCKFTNETRNAMEEASAESGQSWLCVVNGPCAGGGYELALACRADRDGRRRQHLGGAARGPAAGRAARHRRPHAPGRQATVRRDRADYFCTLEEGIKGKRAVEWNLVDEVVPRSKLEETARRRAPSARPAPTGRRTARGIALTPLARTLERRPHRLLAG